MREGESSRSTSRLFGDFVDPEGRQRVDACDDERDVVFEAVAATPLAQLAEDGVGDRRGPLSIRRGQPTGDPVRIQELAGTVSSFRDPVGVEQDRLTGPWKASLLLARPRRTRGSPG